MIPLGHKQNNDISNEGIDTVTGLPATTAGPNASGNPVVPADHPAAIKAMQKNKTGTYSEVKAEDVQEAILIKIREAQGSGSEKYGDAGTWTDSIGQGLTDNTNKAPDTLAKLTSADGTPVTELKTPAQSVAEAQPKVEAQA